MTQADIDKQIEAIRRATREATRTPETARQFLIDAGILKPDSPRKSDIEAKPKK